jgi:arylsulfatase
MGSGDWQLYNLEEDPAETTDLSAQFPEVKKQLMQAWAEYAKTNAVHDHKGHFDAIYRKSFSVNDKE